MSTDSAGGRPEGISPSQTVGPFFHYGLTPGKAYSHVPVSVDGQVAEPGTPGEKIVLTGRVIDGAGEPVPDAMLEIWQADADGRYAHPNDGRARQSNSFMGFGRSDTDAQGTYRFVTVRPGRVPGPGGGEQAPHILVAVFGRGMLKQLFTRVYFEDEASNAEDPILALVPEARRGTLIARKNGHTFTLDIRLQGEGETVFFDV
ncbi:protocatechuate 3,4-dioxygenase subunit alpha [Phreatobacter cathodiphilus]|uniref:Protocatechuate 3,4-dioxygenase subunit alpha n=1 Tax=Phreatobacter cathodiphilus TaxID=1868589 RepID=A0A2S0NG51_9HYPH|nr:protocatechuate 3,4-dioxygenase subunit alpha [Phreatobacter cathodiphilus]AVO46911.1 protocatechuate 3,4-dioxygenase subunit alpha [Phreatobacter cathodiphilus]